jgi:SH3-like domain-containing protein
MLHKVRSKDGTARMLTLMRSTIYCSYLGHQSPSFLSVKPLKTLFFILLFFYSTVWAGTPLMGDETTLPLPRYASLKKDKTNVRTGPGKRYPIEWVFVREKMPVLIIAEYESWRKIRDFEGVEGWVLHNMLTSQRTVLVIAKRAVARKTPTIEGYPVADLAQSVVATLKECTIDWCLVRTKDYEGWVEATALWGINKNDLQEHTPLSKN